MAAPRDPTIERNPEIERFIEHIGSVKGTAEYLGCTVDMVHKMRNRQRIFLPKVVRKMYHHPGFKLDFKELFELDRPESSVA